MCQVLVRSPAMVGIEAGTPAVVPQVWTVHRGVKVERGAERDQGAAWEAGNKTPCRTKAPASSSSSCCLCLQINSLQAVTLALPLGLEALIEEQSPGRAGMAGELPDGAVQVLPACFTKPRVPWGRQEARVGAERAGGHHHWCACIHFLYG